MKTLLIIVTAFALAKGIASYRGHMDGILGTAQQISQGVDAVRQFGKGGK